MNRFFNLFEYTYSSIEIQHDMEMCASEWSEREEKKAPFEENFYPSSSKAKAKADGGVGGIGRKAKCDL